MPFHQRSIEPRRVSRLSARGGWISGEDTGGRRLRKPVLFSSLDEVGCHTLTNIIHQLSDLSRHASDIFLGIEMEAGMVFRRSCRIQGRLQSLQGEVCKFDPKKIKIRKFAELVTCWWSAVWVYVGYLGYSSKLFFSLAPQQYFSNIVVKPEESVWTSTWEPQTCNMCIMNVHIRHHGTCLPWFTHHRCMLINFTQEYDIIYILFIWEAWLWIDLYLDMRLSFGLAALS